MTVEAALRAVVIASFILFALSLIFGALALLLRLNHDRTARRIARLEERWTASLMLVLAGELDADALRAQVRPSEQMIFLTTLVEYAKRLRGAERRLLCDIAEPYLPLVAARVRRGNRQLRARAVHTLATLGLPRYADLVAAALDDASNLVAMKAAYGLARADLVDRAPAVLQRLHRFRHWNPRYLASMLENFGVAAAPLYREALADPTAPLATRIACATALAELNDPEAADVAATVLERAPQRELIIAALSVLRAVGGPRHALLVRRFAGSSDDDIRARAISSIPAVSMRVERGDLLVAVTSDPSAWVALRAADGLRDLDAVAALEPLAAQADHPRAELAREVLADARGPV